MIKSFKKVFYKNFTTLLKKPTVSAKESNNFSNEGHRRSNKSSFLIKSLRNKTLNPDVRQRVESIGLVLTDRQLQLYNDMMVKKDVSIIATDKQIENILLKQILSTLALKQFKNLQTHTIFVTVFIL
jgi:hypothetical protein